LESVAGRDGEDEAVTTEGSRSDMITLTERAWRRISEEEEKEQR